MLDRAFFLRDAFSLAPELLGKVLVHQTPEGRTAGVITELEVYAGVRDKGSHSYGGRRTPRTEIQFGPGGYAYVYMLYGVYYGFNIVAGPPGDPQVVFLRALRPTEGLDLMCRRRSVQKETDLCSGPGKLCRAMGITRAQYGLDLLNSPLTLEDAPPVPPEQILVSPRVNIDYAEEDVDKPWRFYLRDDPFVSKVPRRYRDAAMPFLP